MTPDLAVGAGLSGGEPVERLGIGQERLGRLLGVKVDPGGGLGHPMMSDMQLVDLLGDPAPGDQLGLQGLLLPAKRPDLLLKRAGA